MDASERIRQICKELKLPQREFAKSVGLAETSIAGILGKKSSVTKLLANSIELKHGYRAAWILEGIEPKKVPGKPITTEDQYYISLGMAAEAHFQDPKILNSFLETGLFAAIDQDIVEQQRKGIRKMKLSEKAITTRQNKQERLVQRRRTIMSEIRNAYPLDVLLVIILRLYLAYFENDEEIVIDFQSLNIDSSLFNEDARKQGDELIRLNMEMFELWEDE